MADARIVMRMGWWGPGSTSAACWLASCWPLPTLGNDCTGIRFIQIRLAAAMLPLALREAPLVVMRKWQGSTWRTKEAVRLLTSLQAGG